MSYDGHKGTDFRLPTRAAMREGVAVLAAADGVVEGLRDGMPDIAQGEPGAPELAGRDCGNGVLLVHLGGWTTQYCHLREGSVTVDKGQRVRAGEPIGLVGLSGRSQFPHLHITVRDPRRRVIDPFDSRHAMKPCDAAKAGDQLWAEPLPYSAGGVLSAGFTESVPDYSDIRDHAPDVGELPRDAAAVVAWAHFYGLRAGDTIRQEIVAPGGQTVAEQSYEMPRDRATQYRAVGRKRPDPGWPAGTYRATAELLRDDAVIATTERTLEIR
jgi:hypothetical protein